MFRSSLDAIRSFLKANFPNVTRIYVNNIPAGFVRPSFFIDLVTGVDDDLCRAYVNRQITWQIVYFAPVDNAQNPDVFDQLNVSDTIQDKLGEGMTLTAPDGTIYAVINREVGPRDSEVYATIRLEADFRRMEPEMEKMQDVQYNQKGD